MTAKNVFALQDDLAEQVATAVAGAYGVISLARFRDTIRRPPEQFQSYECVLRVYAYMRLLSPETHLVARECLESAVNLDPHYGDAWAWLSFIYVEEHSLGYNAKPSLFQGAQEALRKTIELDPSNPVATVADANYLYFKHDPRFFERAREAFAVNPRDSFILALLGQPIAYAGKWDEGLAIVQRAIDLDPLAPGWFYIPFSVKAYLDGDYRRGLAFAQKIDMPGFYWYHVNLAIQYAGLGELEKAREQANLVRQSFPDFERQAYAEYRIWFWVEDDIEKSIDLLRKAGLDIPDEV